MMMNEEKKTEKATALYAALARVDVTAVDVATMNRSIPRKEQAALARGLFKKLGLKGISVTAPNYSMAQSVDVRLPDEGRQSWVGFEQWENATFSDMPDNVPAKAAMLRHSEAVARVDAILLAAFPNHDNRSETQSDYFDYCWSVS